MAATPALLPVPDGLPPQPAPAGRGRKPGRLRPDTPAPRAAVFNPYVLAGLLASVAALTLMVSLKHLADGIQRITQSNVVEAWACAIIFDLSYCLAELVIVLVPTLGLGRRDKLAAYGVITTCTVTSVVLNCLAFRAHATTTADVALATSWGTAVPLLVLTLAYLATSVLLAARRAIGT